MEILHWACVAFTAWIFAVRAGTWMHDVQEDADKALRKHLEEQHKQSVPLYKRRTTDELKVTEQSRLGK
jgi:hypothetical protein